MPAGATRLAAEVRAKRQSLRLSQAEFARRIGVSLRTVGNLESGRPQEYTDSTGYAVERALDWQKGSFEDVLAGGSPRPIVDPALAQLVELWPALSGDAREMLLRVAREVIESR